MDTRSSVDPFISISQQGVVLPTGRSPQYPAIPHILALPCQKLFDLHVLYSIR
jgi:hypothetical protein